MIHLFPQLRHADDAHGEGQDDPAGHDRADRLEVRHARSKVKFSARNWIDLDLRCSTILLGQ